jgi:hypothetical protein
MPKNKARKKETQKRNGFARNVNAVLSGKFLTREYVLSNLGFIFFCVFIMVCYIGYGYFAEKNLKTLAKSESDLQELKARNLSTHARLEQLKQQSHVAQSIKNLGLVESTTPPVVLTYSSESEITPSADE